MHMRLSKQTHYAIQILVFCARTEGALVKVAEIARMLGISPQNTFKSVHLLAKAGFLAPVRGRQGGVRLARLPSDIRISDVVKAVEFQDAGGLKTSNRRARSSAAPIEGIIDAAFAAFLSVLDGHTLADLAGSGARRPAKAPAARPRQSEPASRGGLR
jgi:Rrf2 family protein